MFSHPLTRRPLIGALLVLATAVCGPAGADEGAAPPGAVVRETVDAIVAVLGDESLSDTARRRQAHRIIATRFDFTAMSSHVLATNWNKASSEQQRRFTALFRELLSNTYWRRISRYSNETVDYTGEQLRSDKLATVNTVIRTSSADIPVDYKLYLREDRWMAYDVVIEQMSLVRNYRTNFQDLVNRAGIDGLIADLETKVAASATPRS